MKQMKKLYANRFPLIREHKRKEGKVVKQVTTWIAGMDLHHTTILVTPNYLLGLSLKQVLERNGNNIPSELAKAVHERLLVIGNKNYEHVVSGVCPDHVHSPEALGYLLSQKTFPKKLAEAIRFDHGETLELYQSFANGLIARIVKQLACHIKKPKETEVSDLDGLFCDGVCCC